MTYMDDLFIAAVLQLVNAIIAGFRRPRSRSSSQEVRFSGMEVSPGSSVVICKVTQQSYVKRSEVQPRKIPIARDKGFEIQEEERTSASRLMTSDGRRR